MKDERSLNLITKNSFNECDYLNYMIKETLQIYPSFVESILINAIENVKTCVIPIPK